MGDHTQLVVTDHIARLTLHRPDAYNALDLSMARELAATLLRLSSDPAIHGVIVTGAGTAFCAGGDLKEVIAHKHGPAAAFHALASAVHVAVTEIRRMRKPVIAAINGVAAGGGFSLALACDFRVMAPSARLQQGYTSRALCMDAGGSFMLPRLVGLARAMEIIAFDAPIPADQAVAWGLATAAVEEAALLDAAQDMARRIAERSLHAFGWSKALLTDSFNTAWETQLEDERSALVVCATHPEGAEGLRAFAEKRPPRYRP